MIGKAPSLMPAGRPSEDRVKLTIHVTKETAEAISDAVDKTKREKNTQGKIVDRLAKRLTKKPPKPTP